MTSARACYVTTLVDFAFVVPVAVIGALVPNNNDSNQGQ
jgi:hypothetical protein